MDLISKKDLLLATGISYGQLYRWKRAHLIPEKWFIKQASYTGQETFFPREQILKRIQAILDAKDSYTLEEMAKIFSPENAALRLDPQALCAIEEIDSALLELWQAQSRQTTYDFFDIVLLSAFCKACGDLSLSSEQAQSLMERCRSAAACSPSRSTDLFLLILSLQEHHVALVRQLDAVRFDSQIKIVNTQDLGGLANALKLKYKTLFQG